MGTIDTERVAAQEMFIKCTYFTHCFKLLWNYKDGRLCRVGKVYEMLRTLLTGRLLLGR